MKGIMRKKKLRKSAAYYTAKDYDEIYGGDFTLFIEPFVGNEGEFFYYARELENGEIEIMGEGYIVTDNESLNRHKKRAKKELNGDYFYYWIDDNGNVIKETCM